MTAKHLEMRKAVPSPDFKTFMVLYFLFACFLCLHRLNVDTSVSAFNKKKEGFEVGQIQQGLTTLSSLAPLIRVWKVANSQFYTNSDLPIPINMSVGVQEPICRWTIYLSKSVR